MHMQLILQIRLKALIGSGVGSVSAAMGFAGSNSSSFTMKL